MKCRRGKGGGVPSSLGQKICEILILEMACFVKFHADLIFEDGRGRLNSIKKKKKKKKKKMMMMMISSDMRSALDLKIPLILKQI